MRFNRILLIVLALSLLTPASLLAQKKKEVLLKFNKQEGLLRIVLEAEEGFINRVKVTTSPSEIRLDFPEPYDLKRQKDMPFRMTPAEKSLVISVQEKSEVKFFKLSSPARIVFDIRTTEAQSETTTPAIPSRNIVIDAGHGGYDFGITRQKVNEKDLSLALARDLGAAFAKKGKKVSLARKADQYLSLMERINFVNQKRPDLFISLHASLLGTFVIYGPRFEEQGANETASPYSLSVRQKNYAGKSKTLSDCLEKAIKEEFSGEVVRREMPLPVLNYVGAPAVLIEYPSPEFLAYDQPTKKRLIDAIMNGIAAYGNR